MLNRAASWALCIGLAMFAVALLWSLRASVIQVDGFGMPLSPTCSACGARDDPGERGSFVLDDGRILCSRCAAERVEADKRSAGSR